MKEKKIIAYVGIYGSLILANTSKDEYSPWLFMGLAIILVLRLTYLEFIK